MRSKRIGLAVVAGVIGVIVVASVAVASSTLDEGAYKLTLPGVADFEFEFGIDPVAETVTVLATPSGYEVDDDDADKAAWKDGASMEVEVKLDKIEADVNWKDGEATLSLPDDGSITVTYISDTMTVTADGGWYPFGSGTDWYVANNADIDTATKFFKVEANEDGVELKPVEAEDVDEGFLNDLDDDETEEVEIEEIEIEDEGSEEGNNAGGNGHGKPSDG